MTLHSWAPQNSAPMCAAAPGARVPSRAVSRSSSGSGAADASAHAAGSSPTLRSASVARAARPTSWRAKASVRGAACALGHAVRAV